MSFQVPKSKTGIEYIIIADESTNNIAFFPPHEYVYDFFNFIKRCPKDLLQLTDAFHFYSLSKIFNHKIGYDIQFYFGHYITDYRSKLLNSKRLQLFLINSNNKDVNKLLNDISKNSKPNQFIYKKNFTSSNLVGKNFVSDPLEFLTKIINNQSSIIQKIYKNDEEINLYPSCPLELNNYKDFPFFMPAQNNFFQIENILGNFGYIPNHSAEEENHQIKSKSIDSIKKTFSFERQELLLRQIQIIDSLEIDAILKMNCEYNFPKKQLFSPLIILMPCHNPDLFNIFLPENDRKKDIIDPWKNIYLLEQTSNYTNILDAKIKFSKVHAALIQDKFKFFDDVCFLHASFTDSPVLRFPIQGKNIFKVFSLFEATKHTLVSSMSAKAIIKSIKMFSDSLKKQTISPLLEETFKYRNGQVVAITDLPIEWLEINEVPFSFTHDICKIPENSLSGILSHFGSNNFSRYTVPNDLIKNTVLIFGSAEGKFKEWYNYCKSHASYFGYKVYLANNLDEVENIIVTEKPQLLIFDCHGGYDSFLKTTYLVFGKEKLFNDEIIKRKIVAPLVVLSACSSNPLYGFVNSIANGFYEAGAYSVTTTYLPIDSDTGSLFNIHLINIIFCNPIDCLFENWLELISYNIRRSTFIAFLLKLNIDQNDLIEELNIFSNKCLSFRHRRELYLEFTERFIIPNQKRNINERSDFNHEFLFYSNYGRSDLILFENWIEKNKPHIK
jgi:hypothetical protein